MSKLYISVSIFILSLVHHVVFAQYDFIKNDSILVYGEGEVSVPVKYIEIYFVVTSLEESGSAAQQRNNTIINNISSVLKRKFKIQDTQLITEGSRLYPEYIYEKEERKLAGFRARDRITLQLENIEDYSEVLATLTKSSIEEIDSINFIPSTDEKYYNIALERAIKKAREKADVLAKASNRSIKAISFIEELLTNQLPFERRVMMGADSHVGISPKMTNSTIQDSTNIQISVKVMFLLK